MPIRKKIRPEVHSLIKQLVDAGYETYLVGGAVRDLLLGLEPKDYDIATAASPEEIRSVFTRRRARIIGRRFRLVHVYQRGEVYEVSTFRRQPTPEERRETERDDGVTIWRDNCFGSLEQDAKRRDFSANALYYDVVGDRGIIDLVGGLADIKARRVVVIGDAKTRLAEDPVRILRALKLVGQFGFSLSAPLAKVIHREGDKILLSSRNRLFEELLKILASPKAIDVFSAFHEHGFLAHFCPGLEAVWEKEAGQMLQRLLVERGRRMVEGKDYSSSKTLALATFLLVPVIVALNNGDLHDLWEGGSPIERRYRGIVQDFLFPMPISRYLGARVRDILFLLPRFHAGLKRGKIIRHPEYRYGYEIFSLWQTVTWRDLTELEEWPTPPEKKTNKRPSTPRRSRRGPRRKPRNSSSQGT